MTSLVLHSEAGKSGVATQLDLDQFSGKEEIVLPVNGMDDRWLEGDDWHLGWLLKRKGLRIRWW